MRQHERNTATRYEFTFRKDNQIAFTLWFMDKKPSLNKVYRSIQSNFDVITKALNVTQFDLFKENTGVVVKAGEFIGSMTGRTLLQARGYDENSYK